MDDQTQAQIGRHRMATCSARLSRPDCDAIFDYKNRLGIDRTHGCVRRFAITHAARAAADPVGCAA
jgi:hypothetical protein